MQWKYCLALALAAIYMSAAAQNFQGISSEKLNSIAEAGSPAKISRANNPTPFTVGNIYITGNKKTKPYIILRELTFKKGDSIYLPELVKAFGSAHDQLINTLLFTSVVVSLKGFRGYVVDVEIDVIERWYIIPLPYFRPVDRNLTVWQEHNYSLGRVNYGLKYTQNNFSGRNDNVVLWLITGYSQQAEISYDQPYADRSLKHGFGFSIIYSENNQIDAITTNNRQYFINADSISYAGKYLSEQFSLSLRYYYRPAIKTKHLFRLGLNSIKIDSAVAVYNPDYKQPQPNLFLCY